METKYSEFVFEKEFTNEISKKAYLEACKWLAQNVYSKPDLSKYLIVQILKETRKIKKKQMYIFKVRLFVSINENEVSEECCKKCKQLYTIFYCIDKPDCRTCKMNSYKRTLENNIKNLKETLENKFNEEFD